MRWQMFVENEDEKGFLIQFLIDPAGTGAVLGDWYEEHREQAIADALHALYGSRNQKLSTSNLRKKYRKIVNVVPLPDGFELRHKRWHPPDKHYIEIGTDKAGEDVTTGIEHEYLWQNGRYVKVPELAAGITFNYDNSWYDFWSGSKHCGVSRFQYHHYIYHGRRPLTELPLDLLKAALIYVLHTTTIPYTDKEASKGGPRR